MAAAIRQILALMKEIIVGFPASCFIRSCLLYLSELGKPNLSKKGPSSGRRAFRVNVDDRESDGCYPSQSSFRLKFVAAKRTL